MNQYGKGQGLLHRLLSGGEALYRDFYQKLAGSLPFEEGPDPASQGVEACLRGERRDSVPVPAELFRGEAGLSLPEGYVDFEGNPRGGQPGPYDSQVFCRKSVNLGEFRGSTKLNEKQGENCRNGKNKKQLFL